MSWWSNRTTLSYQLYEKKYEKSLPRSAKKIIVTGDILKFIQWIEFCEGENFNPQSILNFWSIPERRKYSSFFKLSLLHYVILRNQLEILQFLIEKKHFYINHQYKIQGYEHTNLCKKDKHAHRKNLRCKGCEMELIHFPKSTGLHIAAKLGFTEIVKYLLDRGIDKDIRNHLGEKAEDICANENIKKMIGRKDKIRKSDRFYIPQIFVPPRPVIVDSTIDFSKNFSYTSDRGDGDVDSSGMLKGRSLRYEKVSVRSELNNSVEFQHNVNKTVNKLDEYLERIVAENDELKKKNKVLRVKYDVTKVEQIRTREKFESIEEKMENLKKEKDEQMGEFKDKLKQFFAILSKYQKIINLLKIKLEQYGDQSWIDNEMNITQLDEMEKLTEFDRRRRSDFERELRSMKMEYEKERKGELERLTREREKNMEMLRKNEELQRTMRARELEKIKEIERIKRARELNQRKIRERNRDPVEMKRQTQSMNAVKESEMRKEMDEMRDQIERENRTFKSEITNARTLPRQRMNITERMRLQIKQRNEELTKNSITATTTPLKHENDDVNEIKKIKFEDNERNPKDQTNTRASDMSDVVIFDDNSFISKTSSTPADLTPETQKQFKSHHKKEEFIISINAPIVGRTPPNIPGIHQDSLTVTDDEDSITLDTIDRNDFMTPAKKTREQIIRETAGHTPPFIPGISVDIEDDSSELTIDDVPIIATPQIFDNNVENESVDSVEMFDFGGSTTIEQNSDDDVETFDVFVSPIKSPNDSLSSSHVLHDVSGMSSMSEDGKSMRSDVDLGSSPHQHPKRRSPEPEVMVARISAARNLEEIVLDPKVETEDVENVENNNQSREIEGESEKSENETKSLNDDGEEVCTENSHDDREEDDGRNEKLEIGKSEENDDVDHNELKRTGDVVEVENLASEKPRESSGGEDGGGAEDQELREDADESDSKVPGDGEENSISEQLSEGSGEDGRDEDSESKESDANIKEPQPVISEENENAVEEEEEEKQSKNEEEVEDDVRNDLEFEVEDKFKPEGSNISLSGIDTSQIDPNQLREAMKVLEMLQKIGAETKKDEASQKDGNEMPVDESMSQSKIDEKNVSTTSSQTEEDVVKKLETSFTQTEAYKTLEKVSKIDKTLLILLKEIDRMLSKIKKGGNKQYILSLSRMIEKFNQEN